ncbi:MAG: IS110 family transposase [Gammaproteobacteria bacterium]|nr:IS110 family transposase [Gammaproteobacteria bacterium]
MKLTTIGLDLAKSVFHVVCFNEKHQEVSKKMLRRSHVLEYFAQLEPCLVAMEACAGAQYWGRELKKLGHTVKLIPPQFVKPYVKGNKNDYNDARAIAEAATRPGMRFVGVKTEEQQDIQALHRLRQQRVKERTALCNQMRALVAEYGIVMNKGVAAVRRGIPELLEDAENGLSDRFRALLAQGYEQLGELEKHIDYYTRQVELHSRQNEQMRRLQALPGFGPIVSSVFASAIGDGSAFKRGRDVSASLGLVPRQHSSGGKDVLLGISKRGDKYLRSLLIHGARSVVIYAKNKDDSLSRWINRIRERRGTNKAAVALANKLARMGWALLRNKTEYCPA